MFLLTLFNRVPKKHFRFFVKLRFINNNPSSLDVSQRLPGFLRLLPSQTRPIRMKVGRSHTVLILVPTIFLCRAKFGFVEFTFHRGPPLLLSRSRVSPGRFCLGHWYTRLPLPKSVPFAMSFCASVFRSTG